MDSERKSEEICFGIMITKSEKRMQQQVFCETLHFRICCRNLHICSSISVIIFLVESSNDQRFSGYVP